ncbi:MAG: pentapeptide repeat-containing protein [Rhodospirillaceae bacterium]
MDELKPPSDLGVLLPASAESALLKALAVRPQDRWHNALSFAEALRIPDSVTRSAASSQARPTIQSRPSSPGATPALSAEDLRTALEAHDRFVQKKQNGRRLSLPRRDLSCLKLGSVNLSDADLPGTVFSCADLVGSNFTNANLYCADFTGANLRHAKFDNCDLRGARFDNADLTGSSLEGADCREGVLIIQGPNDRSSDSRNKVSDSGATSFHTVNLSNAVLRGADLQGALFTQALLDNADLSKANLENASMRGANLANAKFEGTKLINCDFNEANLRGVNTDTPEFSRAKGTARQITQVEQILQQQIGQHKVWVESLSKSGKRMVLKVSDLSGLQMVGVNWSAAEFFSTDLTNANLERAVLAGAAFTDCRLSRAAMAGIDARGVKFMACALEGADFRGSTLSPIVVTNGRKIVSMFCESDLRAAFFIGARCEGADFRNTDLRNANFENAVLSGANFEGARLEGANFKGALTAEAIGLG